MGSASVVLALQEERVTSEEVEKQTDHAEVLLNGKKENKSQIKSFSHKENSLNNIFKDEIVEHRRNNDGQGLVRIIKKNKHCKKCQEQ